MEHVKIPKDKIIGFLDAIKKRYRVAAPVRKEGKLEFKEIKSAGQAEFGDDITYKSPKEFFFPPAEPFLRFDKKGGIIAVNESAKTVIFGVRPCDLYALKALEKVFAEGKHTDPIFMEHRKNTITIGMGCINEKPGCFCADIGVNKEYSNDCDIFLSDNGEYYIAGILTEAGKALIEEFLPCIERTEKKPAPEPKAAKKSCKLELNAGETELFEKINWERISETCLSCGICTYVCPTCHCFEFRDVIEKGESVRYRCWDSCMYPKFTLHASGHNPRPSKKERYRQRILHKYLYMKLNYGLTACFGCGRCIRSCPAGINIKTVVKGIMEELH